MTEEDLEEVEMFGSVGMTVGKELRRLRRELEVERAATVRRLIEKRDDEELNLSATSTSLLRIIAGQIERGEHRE